MIQLPSSQSGKYTVTNNSDLFGSIWYTKNIIFDTEGYIRLSPRAISIQSEKDTGNIRLPLAFGRKNTVNSIVPGSQFAMTQSGTKGYWVVLDETQIAFNIDTGVGVPTLSADSHGEWFANLWHVTDDTDLYSKASIVDVATYTSRAGAGLTSGKAHPIEVFKNRDTLCVGNGNKVEQFSNAYADISLDLTLPTDYEVIGLSYSDNRMGVITMLSDTASGQNQEALFFSWLGNSTSAGSGTPIGSDKAIAITPYKSSWVILTRTGQLLFWNGGGFNILASFPFYFENITWGQSYSRDLLGDVLSVDGDIVYINFNGVFNASGNKYQTYLQNNPGGIWCYDPAVGLYHRHSPSLSPANILTVTSGNINTSTDIMTKTAGTIPSTGSPIKYIYDRGNQIGGLTTPTVYYCIKHTSTTFSLAATKTDADNGVKVNLTSTGAANNYFLALEVYDFGANIATKSGGIGAFDVNSAVYRDLIFGSELNDYSTQNDFNHVNILSDGFENRGYIVTSKIVSQNAQDVMQKLLSAYKPLKSGDSIVYKYKDEDLIGLPVSSTQARSTTVNLCSWTSATTFTTTTDMSDALTAYSAGKELQCEVIGGAGAGTLVKIDSISYSSPTYTIVLSESVTGAASGRYCDVLIDNWNTIGTIDYSSNKIKNLSELPIGVQSNWFKIQVELRGTDVTIFNQKFINAVHKQAE